MRTLWCLVIIALLGGCADMLADQALKDAQAKCAKLGKQFVEDTMDKTELVVVSAAKVSGRCVGPGDPDYRSPG
jgi:hypothetical protein